MEEQTIEVFGAREHNLQNIDVSIPRDKLVVITGLSGSGKSSLAFDTLYAEGQRRYIETFSAYARQLLGGMERPDVDKIEGLSPVVAIEQKTTSKSPRSTVGTITEIYDFLRLLYARVGTPYSYVTGLPMISYSEEEVVELIQNRFAGKKIAILAPVVRARKGIYRELFLQIAKKGFAEVRINGDFTEIEANMQLDRYKTHDIEIVIDKMLPDGENSVQRLRNSVESAMAHGDNVLIVWDYENKEEYYYSKDLMCPQSGISYAVAEPNTFSFNSPKGACPACNGLGVKKVIDLGAVLPDPQLSIAKGALAPLQEMKHPSWMLKQINAILSMHSKTDKTPFKELPVQAQDAILQGLKDTVDVKLEYASVKKTYKIDFEGLIPYLERVINDAENPRAGVIARRYAEQVNCDVCHGTRLKTESLHFKIDEKSIAEVSDQGFAELKNWIEELQGKLSEKQNLIASGILKEITSRIDFLLDVGLDYLHLSRSSRSLSGGEAQRIRLATQIGTQLVNVLYILDEPSIGLHPRDNTRLIHSLQSLRDVGNSVIVVEHDEEMIRHADHVIDMGPHAGYRGGKIVWQGEPENLHQAQSMTAEYLSGTRSIAIPKERRQGNGQWLKLKGATGHNLKNVNLSIPLGTLTVVTGVSGSGKSTLINETLYPILNQHFYNSIKKPLPYKKLEGLEHLDKVIDIDQSPIGRTPRSNPATYTNLFSDIRNLFANLPEAKIRGYKPGRFSFNVRGGRCETCEGAGLRVIEMNFLPDIYVHCETCQGKRFNRETLEVRYKGKSIADVLDMSVDDAVEFFQPIPSIHRRVSMLQEVGLGYITLGQQSTTLSGGEAQRVKLATELSKKQTGNTIYILDEPTTGLHFEDVRVLMEVLQRLVDLGNTVLVIEHNTEVMKVADYIIDIGPEGGVKGGNIVAEGTPEQILKSRKSHTAKFVKDALSQSKGS